MISHKGMYERFVSKCFPETFQSRMEGFASQCGCGEEYNFRAGFFLRAPFGGNQRLRGGIET